MANIITCVRILCAFSLIFSNMYSSSFYVLYIVCGISDVLDGMVARNFGKATTLGAKLDTIADTVFVLIVLVKVFKVVCVPLWVFIWIIGIAVIKFINIISGIIISGHFVSEHTCLNKITGVLLFIIPLQPVLALIIMTCITATIAAIQEGYYIRTGKIIA